jgi:hypothetical protein
MEIQTEIQISFLKTSNTLSSRLIKYWTKSIYSHVEISFGDFSYNVDTELGLLKYPKSKYNKEEWDVININADISQKNLQKIERFISNQVGLKYDWRGIFLSQFINFGIDSDSKWFCSEFVVKILQLFLIEETIDEKPNKVSPEKIYKILSSYK